MGFRPDQFEEGDSIRDGGVGSDVDHKLGGFVVDDGLGAGGERLEEAVGNLEVVLGRTLVGSEVRRAKLAALLESDSSRLL